MYSALVQQITEHCVEAIIATFHRRSQSANSELRRIRTASEIADVR